jgi:type II secretory pathway component PulF
LANYSQFGRRWLVLVAEKVRPDLEEMLDKVAVYYENEVDNAVDERCGYLEPMIT